MSAKGQSELMRRNKNDEPVAIDYSITSSARGTRHAKCNQAIGVSPESARLP
jgi:hypothetical protein